MNNWDRTGFGDISRALVKRPERHRKVWRGVRPGEWIGQTFRTWHAALRYATSSK